MLEAYPVLQVLQLQTVAVEVDKVETLAISHLK
jgi:hypothetical protein